MPKIINQRIKTAILFFTLILLTIIFYRKIITTIFANKFVFGLDMRDFYSWNFFTVKTLLKGLIPLWCPYAFGGYPFLASLQPAVFYPSIPLYLLLPLNIAYNSELILSILLMAFFMYLWLKEFQLSKTAILCGIMIFIFSGFIVYRIYAGHLSLIRCLLWLPLIFLSTRKALKSKNNPELLFYAIICAWGIGFQIASGIPQCVIYTILNLLIFIFGYIWLNRSQTFKKGILFILGICMLSFLLYLVQIIPTIEGFHLTSIERSFKYSTSFSLPFQSLLTFIYPNLFGSPLNNNYKTDFMGGYFWEFQNYFSILGLSLAVFACLKARKYKLSSDLSGIVIIASSMTVFSLIIALGKNTPFYIIFYYFVPVIKGTRAPARIMGFLSFSMATLSAVGFEIIRQKLKDKFSNKKVIFNSLIFIILAVIYLDLFIFNSPFIKEAPDAILAKYRNILSKIQDLKNNDKDNFWRIDAPDLQNYSLVYSIENIRGANTFYLSLFDNLVNNLDSNKLRYLLNVKYIVLKKLESRTYGAEVLKQYSEAEVVKDLQSHSGWSLKNGYTSTPSLSLSEGEYEVSFSLKLNNKNGNIPIAVIQIIGGRDEILDMQEIKPSDFKISGQFLPFNIRFKLNNQNEVKFSIRYLNETNTSLWVEKIEIKSVFSDSAKIIYQNEDLAITENKDFLARINFVPFAVIAKGSQIINILKDKNYDARSVVLLEDRLPEGFSGTEKQNPFLEKTGQYEPIKIKIEKFGFDKILFSCDAPSKGILLISQIYYPGWHLEIDGSKRKLYKANYAFYGVPIEEGQHNIKLFYLPDYWLFCKIISFSVAISTIIILVYLLMRRF